MTPFPDQDSDRGQRYVVSWIEDARPRPKRHVLGRSNDLIVANGIALVARAKFGADNVWIADRQWAQQAGLR